MNKLNKVTFPAEKQRLLLGLSGGVDSMVLLHLLAETHHEIIAAHVNYKTREPGSDDDQALAEQVCDDLNIPLHVKIADKKNAQGNFQEWARNERYLFFDHLTETLNAKLVLAHHADDLLETQLLKLARGESFLSSSGFSRPDTLYPLMKVAKEELYEYANVHGVRYNEDESNATADYDRNFLRLNIIPKLKERFPKVLHHASIVKDSSEGFNESIKLHLQEITEDGALNREKWIDMPSKLRRLLFSRWVWDRCNISLSYQQLMSLQDVIQLDTGQEWSVNGEWKIVRDRAFFHCISRRQSQKTVVVEIDNFPFQSGGYQFELKTPQNKDDLFSNDCVWISVKADSGKVHSSVSLRYWADGDRIQPLGMKGSKKVKNLLTDEKVSTHQKKEAKVIVVDNELAACLFPSEKSDKIGIIGELFRCKINQPAIKITRL